MGLNVRLCLPMIAEHDLGAPGSLCSVTGMEQNGAQDPNVAAEAKRAAVLIVDDDEQFMRACVRVLQSWNYDVAQASSGEAAVQMARERTFDVILSDINLPGSNGLELLRAVRGNDRDIPVILMTGGPELETARLAVEWGAQSYLIKPLALPQLREALERNIRAHDVARRQRQILAVKEGQARHTLELHDQFDRSLDAMWMAYQPIVSWSQKKVVAYEALMRSTDPTLHIPTDILNVAESLGEVHTLGHKTRGLIAEVLANHAELPGVFINLHVLDLLDEQLYAADNPLVPFAPRIHFEITERMAIEKIPDTHDRIIRLRERGYKIAVDDLGEGYSGLNSFAALEPDAVKLDMSLIRGIERTPTKRRMVHALASLCRELGTPLVAEGVETKAELDILVDLGADWMQGYFFARPDYPFPKPEI
jgi:EAL domain-containing protein (putative c-di-GMP-specific phosphodiesterase class I)